jgi:Raf kinase inhibitor-like YbhB/YbcL family protein
MSRENLTERIFMKTAVVATLLGSSLLFGGNFTLTSSNLKGQIETPQVFNGFGCSGQNQSPQLAWSGVPKGTKSFAITLYDPDAPTGSGWWHWMVVNIPASTSSLPTNASALGILPKGAIEVLNDYGTHQFGGACPPQGDTPHRYFLTIHALDTEKLDVDANSSSALVGFQIGAHTLSKATLISYYGR